MNFSLFFNHCFFLLIFDFLYFFDFLMFSDFFIFHFLRSFVFFFFQKNSHFFISIIFLIFLFFLPCFCGFLDFYTMLISFEMFLIFWIFFISSARTPCAGTPRPGPPSPRDRSKVALLFNLPLPFSLFFSLSRPSR